MADTTIDEGKSVFVSNISPSANEKTVSDFFSFCGKITKLYLKKEGDGQDGRSAVVQFETESAAKTALLLTNALIVDRPISVLPFVSSQPPANPPQSIPVPVPTPDLGTPTDAATITQRNFNDIPDDQRSKTSVIASLLAAGYVLANDALQKAKDYDDKHNLSLQAKVAVEQLKVKAHEIDQTYKISEKAAAVKTATVEKAKQMDEEYKISQKVDQATTSVKNTASAAVAKANENATVQSTVGAIKSTTNKITTTVTSMYNDYRDQTQKAIEEKQRAKQAAAAGGAQQTQQPTAAPAPATAGNGPAADPLADASLPVASAAPQQS